MHKAAQKRAVTPAITTYHHLHHCPHDHAAACGCIGDIPPHAAHTAGFDPHTRSPNCVGRPVTEVDLAREEGLHLGDRSHRSGNHPHSGLLRGPHSAASPHTV